MSDLNENHKVSIKRIIGNVVDKFQLTDVSSRISAMTGWAVEAELKIGSRNSYTKHECEIEIKNNRVCLPDNFVRMIAVKVGNDHLDVTMKDFKQFHKGNPKDVDSSPRTFNAGNRIRIAQPGVPNIHQVNFIGVWLAGETINITIQNDSGGDSTIQPVTYIVQVGDTLAMIIDALIVLINAVGGNIYNAVLVAGGLQIIANTPLVNLQITTYTNSVTGTIQNTLIQRRVLPTDQAIIDPDGCVVDIKTTSPNLANRTAYNLNDGIHAESSNSTFGYGMNDGSIAVSKYAIENGFIHFNAKTDGKVGVAYWGVSLDSEGFPMVDQTHEDAVTHYLMYQLSWADLRTGKISQGAFAKLEERWLWLCGQARGDDELPDDDEMQYLANAWNQLLPLPNHNFF